MVSTAIEGRDVSAREGPGCPRCSHTRYYRGESTDHRPLFVCDSCGHSWIASRRSDHYEGREAGALRSVGKRPKAYHRAK